MNPNIRVFSARWVFPISRAPIARGWVRMQGDRVLEVGSGNVPSDAEDLGDVALLPGLVNAHTHLEFSELTNPIGEPGIHLPDWIGQVVGSRHRSTPESKQAAIQSGLDELIESGTRLAGEITTPPCAYPNPNDELTVILFAEVLGLDPIRAAERMTAAEDHCQEYATAGLSPHAPYSTTLQTIDHCIDYARRSDRAIAMHVAESAAERELLSQASGPFADSLRAMGVWRDEVFPWVEDPFGRLIDRLAQAPRSLLIHGNHLNDHEIGQVARHRNVTVVYCPRTHHYFDHPPHPVDRMLSAGVRVALGTDSRASNPDLNVWKEAQHLLHHRSDLDPLQILQMATISGADAMNQPSMGRIERGCRPGLGIVRSGAASLDEVYADLSTNGYLPLRPGSN